METVLRLCLAKALEELEVNTIIRKAQQQLKSEQAFGQIRCELIPHKRYP
jgi:hypothetical protein